MDRPPSSAVDGAPRRPLSKGDMGMLRRRIFSTLVLTLVAAAWLPAAPGRCADLVADVKDQVVAACRELLADKGDRQ